MKRILLTVIWVLVVLIAFGQKKTVGVYLKDLGKDAQKSFSSEIIPQLNKNSKVEFVLVTKDNYKVTNPFEILINVTSDPLYDKVEIYDYVTEKTEKVKGKDGKVKEVKKKVPHSGVSVSFSTIYYVRVMKVATQEFLYGYGKSFNNSKRIEDKDIHGKKPRRGTQRAEYERKIFKKHEAGINGIKAQFYYGYQRETVANLINAVRAVPAIMNAQSKKCSVLDKEIYVASIVQGKEETIEFAKNKVDINTVLSKIPSVRVVERQDIPDLSKVFSSENALDNADAFQNRDKLVGVDYLFLASGDFYDVIDVKQGKVDRKQFNQMDGKGAVMSDLKQLKSLVKHNASKEMNASLALSKALNYPTKIVKVDKEKRGKAKRVQIQSLTILDLFTKYKVFRIDDEKVGNEVLKREVEIGEIKTNKNISGTCMVGAKVKKGGKEILDALNNGDTLIIKFGK